MNSAQVVFLLFGILALSTFRSVACARNGEWIKHLFDDDDDDSGGGDAAPEPEGATSSSRAELQGWFKIFVIGTGDACFTKEFESGMSETQQFGDATSAEAFISLYGEPECEPGGWGFAYGKIRASVVAAAYERGEECLATVITAVIDDPWHRYSKGDVDVHISGEAVGEAVALCEQSEPSKAT